MLVLQVKQDALIGTPTPRPLFGILVVVTLKIFHRSVPYREPPSGFSGPTRRGMNCSAFCSVVCDFLLQHSCSGASACPRTWNGSRETRSLWTRKSWRGISDGESYDDVAELEAANETLLENDSDKDDLVKQKEDLEEQIAQRRRELAEKEEQIASRDATIAQNEADIQTAKEESEKLEAQRREIEKKREELLQNNAASKKELELLAKNLADAKKRSTNW